MSRPKVNSKGKSSVALDVPGQGKPSRQNTPTPLPASSAKQTALTAAFNKGTKPDSDTWRSKKPDIRYTTSEGFTQRGGTTV